MHRSLLPAVLCLSVLFGTVVAAQDASYTFTTINVPGSISTVTTGINNRGQIVGQFNEVPSQTRSIHGFLTADGVTFTPVEGPDDQFASPRGISSAGQIAGILVDAIGGLHGFVLNGTTFTTVDVPEATRFTQAVGINTLGQVVGFFDDDIGVLGVHGFVATPQRRTPPRP